ncbi:MAG: RNA polymerase sigma factor [Actinomycetota bacterium]|nr:RNA polymerase sigma factor [Actinomycetota bacterium]
MMRQPTVDPLEWGEVYEAHAIRLTRLAVVLVGPTDAYDLVADSVLRAVSSPAWVQVESQGAYLTRTLTNLAHDRRVQRDRRERRELRASRRSPPPVLTPMRDIEREVVVRRALAGLSAAQAAVAFLHYWEDLTIEQIADHLDMRIGTTRTHLARAKRSLRALLTTSEREATS